MQTSAIVLASTLAFGFGVAEAAKAPTVRAAFVLLAQSGAGQTVPMARVILDGVGAPCPTLKPDKGKGEDLSMSPRANPDEKNFPVTVCEAVYPAREAMKVKGEKIVLPKLTKSIDRVTVFGDTGCKHRFQAIGFTPSGDQQRPPQLVVGNSGAALAGNHPKDPFSFPIDGMTGSGFGLSEFGYMEIELAESGAWNGGLLDRKGATLAKCDSSLKYESGVCKPASK